MSKWERRILFGLFTGGIALAFILPAFGREYKVDALWGQVIGLLATTFIVSSITRGRGDKDKDDKED